MNNINKIIIHGNLVKDPKKTEVKNGYLTEFIIASNRTYKGTKETCFVEVQVWGNYATVCAEILKKGDPVIVEGRLKLELWETEGQKNSKHIIIADTIEFLRKKDE